MFWVWEENGKGLNDCMSRIRAVPVTGEVKLKMQKTHKLPRPFYVTPEILQGNFWKKESVNLQDLTCALKRNFENNLDRRAKMMRSKDGRIKKIL